MSTWPELGSLQPDGGGPNPQAPQPPGFFEQLIFFNASNHHVDNLVYFLDEQAGYFQYNVFGSVWPVDAHVDTQAIPNAFAKGVEIDFWTQGVPVHMDYYRVKRPGFHIYRVEAGIGCSVVGSSWKPFCCLHLRDDKHPGVIELEVVPPNLWVP